MSAEYVLVLNETVTKNKNIRNDILNQIINNEKLNCFCVWVSLTCGRRIMSICIHSCWPRQTAEQKLWRRQTRAKEAKSDTRSKDTGIRWSCEWILLIDQIQDDRLVFFSVIDCQHIFEWRFFYSLSLNRLYITMACIRISSVKLFFIPIQEVVIRKHTNSLLI